MPIDKISAAQFAADIATEINNRAPDIDTTYGPVPDADIYPQARVLEAQNDRARKLSFLLSLTDPDEFDGFEADLEGIVFNEGMTRQDGAPSTTTAVFEKFAAPVTDAVVQRGFPLGTLADEASGETVTFVTSEAAKIPVATAASYFDITSQSYKLTVPVVSQASGAASRVGPQRITRALRPLGQFDKVTNLLAAVGGRDAESNTELINRYLLGIVGRQLGTAPGIERDARSTFSSIEDLFVVYGTNALLTRAATDAGAVDVWLKGEDLVQISENHAFFGLGQLISVTTGPMVSVVSVTSGGTTYTEGTDYEVVFDSSGVARSTRGVDGIRFLVTASSPPAPGAAVTITFTYNSLVRTLQAALTDENKLELGRDLLFRRGIDVPIIHTANLRVAAGFNTLTVQTAVETALLAYVDELGLGDDVEASDLQGVVRAITGVDNYIITRLTKTTVTTGTGDIAMGDNEFGSLDASNLTITLI